MWTAVAMVNLSYLKKILFPKDNIKENLILKKLKEIINDDFFFESFLNIIPKLKKRN